MVSINGLKLKTSDAYLFCWLKVCVNKMIKKTTFRITTKVLRMHSSSINLRNKLKKHGRRQSEKYNK